MSSSSVKIAIAAQHLNDLEDEEILGLILAFSDRFEKPSLGPALHLVGKAFEDQGDKVSDYVLPAIRQVALSLTGFNAEVSE